MKNKKQKCSIKNYFCLQTQSFFSPIKKMKIDSAEKQGIWFTFLLYFYDKYLKKKKEENKQKNILKTIHKFPQLNENLYNFYSLFFCLAKSNISISENPLENLSLLCCYFLFTLLQ